uniref:Reverse transcriptase domain-containing protein n=1 Tax=Mesocestoides corti TaxID=53468 RepID=A0A5K3G300_MESCO
IRNVVLCFYNLEEAGRGKGDISEDTPAWVIGNVTRQIQQCLTSHFCSNGTRLFRIIGSHNGAWEGRILPTTASSLQGRSSVYSLELTNNYVELILKECIAMYVNDKVTLVTLSPIRITKFRLQLDVQRVSANRCSISNSRDFFSETIAFPVNQAYPNAKTIYRFLKVFFDDFC